MAWMQNNFHVYNIHMDKNCRLDRTDVEDLSLEYVLKLQI